MFYHCRANKKNARHHRGDERNIRVSVLVRDFLTHAGIALAGSTLRSRAWCIIRKGAPHVHGVHGRAGLTGICDIKVTVVVAYPTDEALAIHQLIGTHAATKAEILGAGDVIITVVESAKAYTIDANIAF